MTFGMCSITFNFDRIKTLPPQAISVSVYSKNNSPLKPYGQLEPSFAGMVLGKSSKNYDRHMQFLFQTFLLYPLITISF